MKKYIKYLIPSFVTFVIVGIIYYFNNLYPFGANPFVQVDADYLYIPQLYNVYDLLHGIGKLFYTQIGLGHSMYASLIIQRSLFSPLNLLLYFVKRENIVLLYGLFIMIKLCLISLSCYIYIDKSYKVNYFYKLLFSILYTFNGFIIFNYFNEIWLDIVILFPLLVLYLNKLLNGGDGIGYIIVLALCFIITFYFSYFIALFIVLYSYVFLAFHQKARNKKVILNLGISTLISFLLSGFSSIPLVYQIINSSRFDYTADIALFNNFQMKSLYLLFSPLLLIGFVKLLTKIKKNNTDIYGHLILVLLYIIPIVIDPINAQLHGGSYWSFPYRYGFITAFLLMNASLYYISKYEKNKNTNIYKRDIIFSTLIIIFGIIGYRLNCIYRSYIIDGGILLNINNEIYMHIIHMTILVYLMSLALLAIKNKWFKYIMLSAVSIYSIFLFTSWTMYYNSIYSLSTEAEELYENMEIRTDGRYKMEHSHYTTGYGFILRVPTLDNWLHIIPSNTIEVYRHLGYHIGDTSVHSYGGTVFSDYLLNFRYVFSNNDKKNDDLYTLIDSYDDSFLLSYNYNNNYGIVFDKMQEFTFDNCFDYQNNIYKNLFNKDNNIINYKTFIYRDLIDKEIVYEISDDEYVYLYTDYNDSIENIYINGEAINDFAGSIKYIGNYHDDITFKIDFNEESFESIMIGSIKKKDMLALSSSVLYKNNKYYVTTDSEKYLFLPINNIKGIHVFNNNKEVPTYRYLDNFICIKLSKGENVVEIKYQLPLFKLGIIFSLIGICLLFLQKKIVPNKLLLDVAYWLFTLLAWGVFIYYYFYSIFKFNIL